MKRLLFLVAVVCSALTVKAQQGTFSGDLMMNLNFFQRDTNIRASGNPLYDNYLSGSEGWLSMRYNVKGFTFFLRADAFNNSNLKNPTSANTAFGIGAWNVTKEMKDLTISVGYIYDQIGSGILFRAYEDRGLLIDNALVGFQLKYKLTKNVTLKGFTGQQKDNDLTQNPLTLSQRYGPIIKGINAEGDFNIGKAHLLPGVGIINRTLDQASMDAIVTNINSKDSATRFYPKYNMYAFAAYNTLSIGNFSWYMEGDYKTHEAIADTSAVLKDRAGNVEYTNISYAQKGFAINLAGKRTENFVMRTSPNQTLLNGMLNWQPVVAVLRPERLLSRYTPASQDISEMAGTANVYIAPNDVTNFTATYTHINTLDNIELYREGYAEGYYQGLKSWIFQGGIQYLEYNQQVYYGHSFKQPILYAITPFAEVTYRFNEKHSLRGEFQYMDTKQDYGSWLFALLEYDIAPKWAITVSDMYNVQPRTSLIDPSPAGNSKANNYYNLYIAYTKGANRFSLAYVKQVDGINCSGGVCRYEPAFSGVKATITSSF